MLTGIKLDRKFTAAASGSITNRKQTAALVATAAPHWCAMVPQGERTKREIKETRNRRTDPPDHQVGSQAADRGETNWLVGHGPSVRS